MYRAIRSINGGEKTTLHHFDTILDAYTWLCPPRYIQEDDRWHLKLMWSIVEEMRCLRLNGEMSPCILVGYDERIDGIHTYIQQVEDYNTRMPVF